MAVLDDLSQIALGLGNGAVLLWDTSRSSSLLEDKVWRESLLRKDGGFVTGVHYFLDAGHQNPVLFVTDLGSVQSYRSKVKGFRKSEVDKSAGAEIKCSCIRTGKQSEILPLVCGRSDAVYFYGVDMIGPCKGFEGDKQVVHWFRDYLIIASVSRGEKGGYQKNQPNLNRSLVTIYEPNSTKFIAFSNKFENVVDIVSEWGFLFVVTKNKVFKLQEIDMAAKMKILFSRKLYPIALKWAQTRGNVDEAYLIQIHLMYADYSYRNKEFETAIAEYIETIGHVEPSYIIRKFLDAQRIHNLTSYLQALHEKGKANPNHTTLLLNCYTKLKDIKKLDEFIKAEREDGDQSPKSSFDVETAINVCQQAGYYDHALYLARKHNRHSSFLSICLDNVKDFNSALKYINTLDLNEAAKNLRIYGKKLLSNCQKEATELLIEICTDYKGQGKVSAVDYIPCFVGLHYPLKRFLRSVYEKCPELEDHAIIDTLIELSVREYSHFQNNNKSLPIHSKDTFIRTEEELKEAEDVPVTSQIIMKLLKSSYGKYNLDRGLIVSKVYDFEEGLIFIYTKQEKHSLILQYYIEKLQNLAGQREDILLEDAQPDAEVLQRLSEDIDEYHQKILQACHDFSPQSPSLWIQALHFFTQTTDGTTHKDEIKEILQKIHQSQLMAPVMVLKILGQNPNITLDVVKEFCFMNFQEQHQTIINNQREILEFQDFTEEMRKDIKILKTQATTFQKQKCDACDGSLDLPVVHFLCTHSFHQRCLIDSEVTCQICSEKHLRVLELQESMKKSAEDHEEFFRQFGGSADGFSVIAEYFGKGIFSPPEEDEEVEEFPKISDFPDL